MKKLLPLVFLFFVFNVHSTNVTISLVSPISFEDDFEVGSDVQFKARVNNLLYLPAEEFHFGIRIFKDQQFQDTSYNEIMYDENLVEYTNKEYTFGNMFSVTEPGMYYGYAYVYYENDIDRSDDTITFSMTFIETEGGCYTEYEHLIGEGLKVDENLSYFPNDNILAGYMQRGDVIGLSAKVSDKDYIHQLCICGDDTTSSLLGLYSDEVYYSWTLEGPGKLHAPDIRSGKVFYEIPLCVTTSITATVNLMVTNLNGNFALDTPISGSFTINIDACPRRAYAAGSTPDWSSSCLSVAITKNDLSNGGDGSHSTKEGAECAPEAIVFDKGNPITVTGSITKTEAEFCKPDYAALLSVEASDYDNFTLKCTGEGACASNDSIVSLLIDPLKYEWHLVSGKGEFPLGNTGSSVVFHKSRSEGATIECSISNVDSKAADDVQKLTITLEAAKKPKAFVGLGDDEALLSVGEIIWGWNYPDDTYYGRNSTFLTVAESMKTKLEDAGYEVDFREHMTRNDLKLAFKNPLFQAVAVVAHGASGRLNMAGRNERLGTITFTHLDLVSANKEAYDCEENPRVRDLQLLACEAARGKWHEGLHCNAQFQAWRTTKRLVSLRYYAYWTYTPLDPVNLSLP